jgi:hypothetical protein
MRRIAIRDAPFHSSAAANLGLLLAIGSFLSYWRNDNSHGDSALRVPGPCDQDFVNTELTIAINRIEFTARARDLKRPDINIGSDSDPLRLEVTSASGKWRAEIGLRQAADKSPLLDALSVGEVLCVIGDSGELTASTSLPYANAVLVRLDPSNSTARIVTSLTGLPPVYIFQDHGLVNISSPFVPQATRGTLRPDMDGIADMLRWGHPIDGRTLFADLRSAPSYSTVTVSRDGEVVTESNDPWPSIQHLSSLTSEELVHEQLEAFRLAAGRIRVANAFISLSGGLDSRASLVGLLSHGHVVPCVTIAGSQKNLDVRLARAFCQAHGLQHHVILLDGAFRARLADLLLESAALTGGISCLSQTVDLFLYENLPRSMTTRISGNLGNQVGRGGVESLSVYHPRAEVFSFPVRERLHAQSMIPWFIPRLAGKRYGEVLFGQEVPYWSIPNYVVGSSRALQLTPYADRRLMDLARAAFARDPGLRHPRWETLRRRDLRHRLAGSRKMISFQRRFLAKYDSAGAGVPLNWGWRAAGGWSTAGCLAAIGTATDAGATKLSRSVPVLRPAARWVSARLDHRSAFADWPQLLKSHLRELTMDTLSSQIVRNAAIFETVTLNRVLADHFSNAADHHYTVARALELALGMSGRSANSPRAAF